MMAANEARNNLPLLSHLLAVVARLVGGHVLVLVGAGPLGGRVLDAALVLPLRHDDGEWEESVTRIIKKEPSVEY